MCSVVFGSSIVQVAHLKYVLFARIHFLQMCAPRHMCACVYDTCALFTYGLACQLATSLYNIIQPNWKPLTSIHLHITMMW